MKKRILCLALCIVMIAALLVGCAEPSREETMNKIGMKASKGTLTVTMYLLSEQPVSPEQEALVEEAVNEYMDDYKVYLDLKYFTEAEYYSVLETNLEKMAQRALSKKDNTTATETAASTDAGTTDETGAAAVVVDAETVLAAAPQATDAATATATTAATVAGQTGTSEYLYIGENGLPKIYYPPNEEFHVDIFYFSGYDRYLKYTNVDVNKDGKIDSKDGSGYLNDFSKNIKDESAKVIKDGISTVLFDGAKTVNGKYNMIPCNTMVGEYTYLLLNKELLKNTNYTVANVGNLLSNSCGEFLKLVNDCYPEYVPLYSSEGTLPFEAVEFFGVDASGKASNDFSLLAGTYDYSWKYGSAGQYPVLDKITASADKGNGDVKAQINKLKSYEFNGYYATADEKDKPFAVGYIKGDISVREKYEDDYEIIVLENPKLETKDIYEHAFAISANTTNLATTSRILAEIYANKDVANILAHGVEGTNYVWKNSTVHNEKYEYYKVIQSITEDSKYNYVMDPNKIGNSAVVYPTVKDNPKRCANIIKQNSEATNSLTFGFLMEEQSYTPALKGIANYSLQIWNQIVAAKDQAALDVAFANMDAALLSPEFAQLATIQVAYNSFTKKAYK